MPTSTTAAPGLTHAPVTYSALPHAAIRMSASAAICCALGVRECTMVTVASRFCSSSAAGRPTMLERPTTTARLPAMGTPDRSSSSMQPFGVQGTNSGLRPRMASAPMFCGWKPSTSFSMSMASSTRCSLMCLGRGSCTRMPCTLGSALYAATTLSTSSSLAVSGRSVEKDSKPTSTELFFLLRTYVSESLRLPTSTTARPGVLPVFAFSSFTSAAISPLMSSAIFLPSMILAA
mmetsp:Transcript_24673/g.62656  ORF Transcript_24673/g.62656 Transcript_24673/m.62656 type:complete len:234 (-) Transcript_24673:241-942(-)